MDLLYSFFLIIWKKKKINCVISSQQQLQEEPDSTTSLARTPCCQARCEIFSSLPLKQHMKRGCSVITLLMLQCARASWWLSTGLITHAAQMAVAGRAHNRPLRGSCDSGREAGRDRARPLGIIKRDAGCGFTLAQLQTNHDLYLIINKSYTGTASQNKSIGEPNLETEVTAYLALCLRMVAKAALPCSLYLFLLWIGKVKTET